MLMKFSENTTGVSDKKNQQRIKFALRKIQKGLEFNIVHHLFIYFESIYASINKEHLFSTMHGFNFLAKLKLETPCRIALRHMFGYDRVTRSHTFFLILS